MCGVIGAYVIHPTAEDFKIIERLFLESKIRGLHATGISYVKNDSVHTIKEALPADKFLKQINLRDCLNEDGNLYMIGHCRYSTSDLEYNQPIATDQIAIVHNGIMTQESPNKWEEKYHIKCTGKNDSELLLYSTEPYKEWPDASFAAIRLTSLKHMNWFRNGKRPLYFHQSDTKIFLFSTKDIGIRSGLSLIQKATGWKYYGIQNPQALSNIHIDPVYKFYVNTMGLDARDYQTC